VGRAHDVENTSFKSGTWQRAASDKDVTSLKFGPLSLKCDHSNSSPNIYGASHLIACALGRKDEKLLGENSGEYKKCRNLIKLGKKRSFCGNDLFMVRKINYVFKMSFWETAKMLGKARLIKSIFVLLPQI